MSGEPSAEAADRHGLEPIAIVGIGCRLPGGVNGPEDLWQALREGRDAVVEVPDERWDVERFYHPDPQVAGKSYTRHGGFLHDDVEQFDPQFFGISAREATNLDPQQRLLLETSWEAIEDAGVDAGRLAGSRTGVFVGAFCFDSKIAQLGAGQRPEITSHTSTSVTMSLLANRLSYVYDLQGPSLAIDTACSSSLVATHYAARSIWQGESDMALAGGVNVMTRPEYGIVMSKGRYLSPTGRCRMFDASADGYVRGEGAGVVLLKPLSAALADGDRIYAQIRASGVNQDGRTAGISYPNTNAQQALIQSVLDRAGIAPHEVGYVEAHGTGTQAGDLAESTALDAIFRQGRAADARCLVGSIKTNIGHLEAAAGVAGLIKAALVVERGEVPPNLHLVTPNPKLELDDKCLQVPTSPTPWSGDASRLAAVNSFGYGGTNAHVLLEAPPAVERLPQDLPDAGPRLIVASARSPEALAARAQAIAGLAASDAAPALNDLAYSLGCRVSHHTHRLAVVADDTLDLALRLETASGRRAGDASPLVFVYTGMGPQWWGMGRTLLEHPGAFRSAIQACDEHFVPMAGWSLEAALLADEAKSQIKRTEVAQPTNFALQYALTKQWQAWGIEPAALVGHSVGEVAAACVAGALTLEEALWVSLHRSRLQQTTAGQGTMLAIGLAADEASALLEGETRVSIAAINSPRGVTLAGAPDALREYAEILEDADVFNRFLDVEVGFHSPSMDPLRDDALEQFARLQPATPTRPLVSTVTGAWVDGPLLDAYYWWRNMREPVAFAAAFERLLEAGYTRFVEVGPHPVLAASMRQVQAAGNHPDIELVASQHRDTDAQRALLEGVGALYSLGCEPDFGSLTPAGRPVRQPRYPWQRKRYAAAFDPARTDRRAPTRQPLLGRPLANDAPGRALDFTDHRLEWLHDHIVDGRPVLPGAAYLEIAVGVAAESTDGVITLDTIRFDELLPLNRESRLQVELREGDDGRFRVVSRERSDDADWREHASGRSGTGALHMAPGSLQALRDGATTTIEPDALYDELAAIGLTYDAAFRVISRIERCPGGLLVQLQTEANTEGYLLHPTLLDGALQSLVALGHNDGRLQPTTLVPVGAERYVIDPAVAGGSACWAWVELREQSASGLIGDIRLYTDEGEPLACLDGLRCQLLPRQTSRAVGGCYYESVWLPLEANKPTSVAPSRRALLCAEDVERISRLTADTRLNVALTTVGDLQAMTANDLADTALVWFAPPVQDATFDAVMAGCVELTALARLAVERGLAGLTIVTQGPGAIRLGPYGSALFGFARVIANEHPQLRLRLLDVDNVDRTAIDALLLAPEYEELLVRDGSLWTSQFRSLTVSSQGGEAGSGPTLVWNEQPETNYALGVGQPGRLATLGFRDNPRRAIAANEVEVRAEWWGMNFKDVLKALGQLPAEITDRTYFGTGLGIEATGRVSRVGSDVTTHQVGDRVITFAPDAFSRFPVADAQQVVAVPNGLDDHEAPVLLGFLTAYHALVDIARLASGERLLIHNATGGVGLGALQIARWLGAEIVATAGTPEKRAYLRELGIHQVFDSRSPRFAPDARAALGGGVDVILGAVHGEGLRAGIGLLNPYGRYVEIGKRDIIDDGGLPLRAFNDNLTFSALDFDRLMHDRPAVAADVVRRVAQRFDAGDFTAIRCETFGADNIADAFRHMAQAKHMGKVVIDVSERVSQVQPLTSTKLRCDGACLITGGTDGFGLELGLWLARLGVQDIVLASRRGVASERAETLLPRFNALGARVSFVGLDVTKADDVAACIGAIEARTPLRGVVHAAMVLDDAPMLELDEQRLQTVLAPKIAGTLNLHTASADCDLDLFLLLSSISAEVGNRGQASYAAANAFLDAFAAQRRAQGLAATSINLGALGDVGVVARDAELERHLDLNGIRALPAQDALAGIGALLAADVTRASLVSVDWPRFGATNRRLMQTQRFADLAATDDDSADSLQALLRLDPGKRSAAIEAILRDAFAGVLGGDPASMSMSDSAAGLGVDSLMAMEIALTLEAASGLSVTDRDVLRDAPLADLVERLRSRLPDLEANGA